MDFIEIVKFLATVGGSGGIVWFIAKLVVKDWFDKGKKIEDLKKQNQKLATDRAKEVITELKLDTKSVKAKIEELAEKIIDCNLQITKLQVELRNTVDKQEDIKNVIKQTVKLEVLELSKNATLYQTKKSGS